MPAVYPISLPLEILFSQALSLLVQEALRRDLAEERGTLGHSSVWRGEYRYFLRFPEDDPAC
jgi:hypothetical protein